MTTRSFSAFCLVMFSMNTNASDMAIVDAVTGNMNRTTQLEQQSKLSTNSSNRTSPKSISKFDYTAQEKAKELKCDAQGSPNIEPSKIGGEILTFSCRDGRQLALHCAAGLGCKAQ
jgi:hypothetical protein